MQNRSMEEERKEISKENERLYMRLEEGRTIIRFILDNTKGLHGDIINCIKHQNSMIEDEIEENERRIHQLTRWINE